MGKYLIKVRASKIKKESNGKNKGKEKENNANGKENINGKGKEIKSNNNGKGKEKSDLAVALYDFNGTNAGELSFHKNDILIITNWNIKEGWAIGYKRNDSYKQGIFPSILVHQYFKNMEGLYS